MSRRPDGWLSHVADPSGPELEAAMDDLVARLDAARDAATRLAGRAPLGLREVELSAGVRHYLCAFEGPGFLCLDADGSLVAEDHVVHRVATVSLVWEQLEAEVDVARLQEVSGAAARVLAVTDSPVDMCEAVAEAAEHAGAVGAWRASPLRATAALPQIDVLFAYQDRACRSYARFVAASEPLVARQDDLTADLVSALGAFERAAIAAGLGTRLAERLGSLVAACGQAADEIVAAQISYHRDVPPGAGR
jgi:hypothetical protein